MASGTFFKPTVLRSVLSPEQAKVMTVMLISSVSTEGTGRKAQVKGFLTAGKTGTAQIVNSQKQGYIKGQYISSFAGFIPAQNPQFVIYVAVEQPQKAFYGSTVAAPVFAQVAGYAVRQANLSPVLISKKNVLKTKKQRLVARHISHVANQQQLNNKTGDPSFKPQITPQFMGLSLREAYQQARKVHVNLRVSGSGLVIRTIPFAGQTLPSNRTVRLILQ